MRWRGLRLIAFDTETTGLHPEDGHRVIEFAGIEFRFNEDGSIREVVPHHHLFNPEMPIPRESTEISGIRDEDVAHAPVFSEHAVAIRKVLDGAVTVAHNYPFDQRFLTAEFERCEMTWPSPPAEIDTVDLSRAFHQEAKSHKLSELSSRLEVTLVGAHRATNDAEACGRCFLELARRYNAPDDIAGLVDWAGAVGMVPDTGHLKRAADGRIVFGEGEFAGKVAGEYPHILTWMTMAKEQVEGRWQARYPDAVVNWIRRWLRTRASGRASASSKTLGAGDWGIDPPIGWR